VAKRKNGPSRPSRPRKDKELQAIYDQLRREFSAADLQKYTEIEEGIPAEQVLAEMEEIHRKLTREKG
jgi:hypothetical protein